MFLIIIIFFLVLYFINSKKSFFSFFQINKEKVSTLPTSFQECDKRYPKKGNFNPSDYIFPFCDYLVEENNSLYQECMSHGGVKIPQTCMNCPGCGCSPPSCSLTYIDPSFILPTNITECRRVFTHSSGRNIAENGGKEYCSITIVSNQGVFNKDVGEKLSKSCFSQNGKAVGYEGCELKFYEQ